MADVCVVHLVRALNGIEPFKRFIESYTKHRGGVDHDLVIVYKGFHAKEATAEYRELLKNIAHQSMHVRDYGFDIRAYFAAVKAFHYPYYCFINSYGYLLDGQWLKKMHDAISQTNAGLIGTSSSCESLYTNYVMGQTANNQERSIQQLLDRAKQWKKRMRRKHAFDPFPNYHIRTNGFMISRAVMNKIRYRFIFNKMDAYKFESGKNSLTKQVLHMRYKVLVVGRDGKAYEKEQWYATKTFRLGDQSNLLIADKQTDAYASAEPHEKRELTQRTWGKHACFGEKES